MTVSPQTFSAALRHLLTALPLAVALSGCGAIRFDVAQDLPEQRVPGSPLGNLLPPLIPSPIPITVDLRSETEKRSTGPASAAFLKSLSLRATPASAPSGNFDFLAEARIFVEARDGSLPRVEVARLVPVPKGQTTVSFTIVEGVDLLPYVNAGAVITAMASGSPPRSDFTYDGRIVIEVRV